MGCQYSLPSPHPLEPHHLHFVFSCQQLVYLEAGNNYQKIISALFPVRIVSLYLFPSFTDSINIYWASMEVLDIISSAGLTALNKTKSPSYRSYVPLLTKVGAAWQKAWCWKVCFNSELDFRDFIRHTVLKSFMYFSAMINIQIEVIISLSENISTMGHQHTLTGLLFAIVWEMESLLGK